MTLSRQEARRVYDRIGARQDSQAFYEDRATGALVAAGDFADARSVIEFGCGTGRFAARLLDDPLPADARLLAIDASPRMAALARERLARFGGRARVRLTGGEPEIDAPDASCDRFVSNYVFDLLSREDAARVLEEARRVLEPGGLLCLCGLSHGCSRVSRTVARLWTAVHARRPAWVGGCRPIDLTELVAACPGLALRHRRSLAAFGIPSEVVIAERAAAR